MSTSCCSNRARASSASGSSAAVASSRPMTSDARRRSARRRSREEGSGRTRRAAASAAVAPASPSTSASTSASAASASASASVGFVGFRVGLVQRPVDHGQLRPPPLEQLRHEHALVLRARAPVRAQEHALLRPGDGHVQEPTLLVEVEVAAGDLLAQELAREPAAPLLLDGPLALDQVRHDDHGELQALRLVEGHEAHALDVLGQLHAGGQLAAGVLERLEVLDELGQGPPGVRGLPVRGEAHEARDGDDGALGLQGAGGQQVQDGAVELQVPLQDGVRAVPPGARVELLDGGEQVAQLRAEGGIDGDAPLGRGRAVGRAEVAVCSVVGVVATVRAVAAVVAVAAVERGQLDLPAVHQAADGREQVAAIELGVAADLEDLQRVQAPRAAGHHPHEGGIVGGVRDGTQGLLQVPDLRRLEEAQAADDGERDVLGLEAVHDGVAVLVLAVQDGDVVPGAAGGMERADGIDDGDGLVLGPGADVELDGGAVGLVGPEALVGREPGLVADDEMVGGGQDVVDAAEVLLDGEVARGRGVWRAGVGMRGRPGEAGVELGEGGEAGAPEAVDGLVVVAHDHDVVGPVRRAAQELDQLDLGDVGVLELVHQDVAVLALPPSKHVGAGLEQAGDQGDLLAEVEEAALRDRRLVGAVDAADLGEAHDLQGGAVLHVGGGELVDARELLCVQAVAAHQAARADDVAAGLPLGGALVLVVPVGLDLEARVLGALPGADLGVVAADHRAPAAGGRCGPGARRRRRSCRGPVRIGRVRSPRRRRSRRG